VAACVAVKAELNESTATAAIKMLRVRIKFLPMFKTLIRSINAERQSQFHCCPLRAKSGHGRSPAYSEHEYFLAVAKWEAIQNVGP
jgi:hypothetical protein